MNHVIYHDHDDPGIRALIRSLSAELMGILQTRFQMLKAELKQKLEKSKAAVPLFAGIVVLLSGGLAALTFAFIALVRTAFFDNPFGWAIGGAIVAFVYLVLGLAGAVLLRRILRPENMIPTRTLNVLKQDRSWLEQQVHKEHALGKDKKETYEPKSILDRAA